MKESKVPGGIRIHSGADNKQTKESIQRDRKYNLYNGIFNNDVKTYLPARTTTLGYEKRGFKIVHCEFDNVKSRAKNVKNSCENKM